MPEPVAAPSDTAPRLTFLDNLRTLMVLLVVVVHVCCAYSAFTFWWFVNDTDTSVVNMPLMFLDIFAMPVLFFIAGYFARPSLARQGRIGRFVVGKLRRLGLPWLLGVVLVTPAPVYLKAYLAGDGTLTTGYWSHCLAYWRDGLGFTTGYITGLEHFNQNHFWFVSLLLFFFLVFAGWRALRGGVESRQTPATRRSMVTAVTLVAVLSSVGTVVAHGLVSTPVNPEPWVVVGNLLQFQPTRLSLYVLYFLLGLHAWSRSWFADGRGVGSVWLWTAVLVTLAAGQLALAHVVLTAFTPAIGLAYVVNRCLLCLTFLLFFLAAGQRFWNTPTKLNTTLAASWYDIYLVHYVVVIGLQALLFVWQPQTSPVLKIVLITPVAMASSYGISRWLIRPDPRRFVGGLFAAFVVAAVLLVVG